MTISSIDAGAKICELGNWQITNQKLQKILYLINLIYLGRNGKSMIEEKFEAWDLGVVEPKLYNKVKFFGANPIKFIPSSKPIGDMAYLKTISEVFEVLKDKTAAQLVDLTHRKDGAWRKVYSSRTIYDEDILYEYKNYYN